MCKFDNLRVYKACWTPYDLWCPIKVGLDTTLGITGVCVILCKLSYFENTKKESISNEICSLATVHLWLRGA